jgi:TRAP-type C4-dicarboxylate transport system substrate-binding protein
MRRSLIASLVAVAAMAALPTAWAQTEIRISTAAPNNSPLTEAFKSIKARMEARFPGQIKVSVHAASALFRQGTELPAMQRGNLEMASPVLPELEVQLPQWGALGAAYLFRDRDHMIKTFRGDIGREFYADVASKMGLEILDADLAGVKMRMPPGPAFQTIANALGATSVSMPITEVYVALKTGTIDAQDNPTNMTRDWKFQEVTKQVILTRHLVQPFFVAIAKPFFDKLTPEQRTELRAATRAAVEVQIANSAKDEEDAIGTFKAANIRIVEPDVAAFRTAVMEQYRKAGLMDKWTPGLLARVEAVR